MKKILFMGTPGFAAASLAALYESGEYAVTVVTQPDKPKGRGYAVTPSEVKALRTSSWSTLLKSDASLSTA